MLFLMKRSSGLRTLLWSDPTVQGLSSIFFWVLFRLIDLDTKEEKTYTLVFPSEANIDENKISILAPIGTAMLGYHRGDTIK